MGPSFLWFWLSLTILSSACSFHEPPLVLQPVGPAPLKPFSASGAPDQGYLVVYSEQDPIANDIYGHSRYLLLSADGKLVQQVKNRTDRYGSGPTHLPLAAGTYEVRGLGPQSRNFIVPVIIKEERTSFVYLDDCLALDAAWARQTNVVKLPDGQIVGWASTPEEK